MHIFVFIISLILSLSVNAFCPENSLSGDGAISMYGSPDIEKTILLKKEDLSKDTSLKFTSTSPFLGVNSFISGGGSPHELKTYLYENMMYRSPAEPFTLYPNIVKVIDLPQDRSYIKFEIVKGKVFNDNSPITTKDIEFTFNLLKKKGKYNYQIAYKNIDIEVIDDSIIKFNINDKNRELPLIIGLMPVLSHKNNTDKFTKQSYDQLLGVSAYEIETYKSGQTITLKRRSDYPKNNCFRFHFNKVKIDFFKNEQSSFEQLRVGNIDFFYENNITRLNRSYDFPSFTNGDYIHNKISTKRPSGMYGFVFNTRRKPFDDIKLREIISKIFNFEILNTHYLYQSENQINSIFMSVDFNNNYQNKAYDNRPIIKQSIYDIQKAGYSYNNGVLYTPDNNKVEITILLNKPTEEKYALLLKYMLNEIGITINLKRMDTALYYKSIHNYDYDMIIDRRYISWSPGTEQRNYWGCAGRNKPGTRNYAGICNNKIESALDNLDTAITNSDLNKAMSEIDKNILAGYYYIPLQASLYQNIIANKKLKISPYGSEYFYWKNSD